MIEQWRDVPDYEGYYQVSSLGRIRSFDRQINCKGNKTRLRKGKVLKLFPNTSGYPSVDLVIKTKRNTLGNIYTLTKNKKRVTIVERSCDGR